MREVTAHQTEIKVFNIGLLDSITLDTKIFKSSRLTHTIALNSKKGLGKIHIVEYAINIWFNAAYIKGVHGTLKMVTFKIYLTGIKFLTCLVQHGCHCTEVKVCVIEGQPGQLSTWFKQNSSSTRFQILLLHVSIIWFFKINSLSQTQR